VITEVYLDLAPDEGGSSGHGLIATELFDCGIAMRRSNPRSDPVECCELQFERSKDGLHVGRWRLALVRVVQGYFPL
jgi:hypothetical protein